MSHILNAEGEKLQKVLAMEDVSLNQILDVNETVIVSYTHLDVYKRQILGYVGAGGLGLILNEKIGWREYSSVGMILLALFVTVFIIESISRAARKRLV